MQVMSEPSIKRLNVRALASKVREIEDHLLERSVSHHYITHILEKNQMPRIQPTLTTTIMTSNTNNIELENGLAHVPGHGEVNDDLRAQAPTAPQGGRSQQSMSKLFSRRRPGGDGINC